MAQLTNFSFEFLCNFNTRYPSAFSIPWCKKVKIDQKLKPRGPALRHKSRAKNAIASIQNKLCDVTKCFTSVDAGVLSGRDRKKKLETRLLFEVLLLGWQISFGVRLFFVTRCPDVPLVACQKAQTRKLCANGNFRVKMCSCTTFCGVMGEDDAKAPEGLLYPMKMFQVCLNEFPLWPDKTLIQESVPAAFKNLYPDTRVIINAVDIEIARSRNPLLWRGSITSVELSRAASFMHSQVRCSQ